MCLPNYAEIRLEFLRLTSTNSFTSVSEYVLELAGVFNLDKRKLELRTPGNSKLFYSRVNFTKKILKENGLITVNDNKIILSDLGEKLLRESPVPVTSNVLERYKSISDENLIDDQSYNDSFSKVLEKSLEKLSKLDYGTFEDSMLDFLFWIGYGTSQHSLKKNIKKSSDGGLDGFIELDPLGVDKLYIQAKHWDIKYPIRDKHIREFSGAIDAIGGNKGIFITTSRFTTSAITCSKSIKNKSIRLIDGKELVDLMSKYNFKI